MLSMSYCILFKFSLLNNNHLDFTNYTKIIAGSNDHVPLIFILEETKTLFRFDLTSTTVSAV